MRNTQQAGFTLIEILVALAILAIALTALTGSANTANKNNLRLQNKTLALWIAEDVLNEKRISHQWPQTGETSGKRTLADQDWQWRLNITTTPAKDIFKASVKISLDNTPDDILISLDTHFTRYTRSRQQFSQRQ